MGQPLTSPARKARAHPSPPDTPPSSAAVALTGPSSAPYPGVNLPVGAAAGDRALADLRGTT